MWSWCHIMSPLIELENYWILSGSFFLSCSNNNPSINSWNVLPLGLKVTTGNHTMGGNCRCVIFLPAYFPPLPQYTATENSFGPMSSMNLSIKCVLHNILYTTGYTITLHYINFLSQSVKLTYLLWLLFSPLFNSGSQTFPNDFL